MAYYPGKTRKAPQPVDTRPPLVVDTAAASLLALKMRGVLRSIKAGRLGWAEEVDGARVLERVVEDKGVTFYHLTHQARGLLRAHGMLPWSDPTIS